MGAFADRYGPWAVVAGASEGLGRAFAEELADRGLGLVLVARRAAPLEALARSLRHKVDVVTVAADLADPAAHERLGEATAGRIVGLVVANAAHAPVGGFLALGPSDALASVDVNCRSPLLLAHRFLPPMVERGRGGLVLMSSLAGHQGSPGITTYAATKAFTSTLAEGLWAELDGLGVDVVACDAGAIETPGLAQAARRRAPGTLAPERVARAALDGLGHGPRVVPGAVNKVAAAVMGRLLPRRAAVRVMARATGSLRPNLPAAPGPSPGPA